TLGFGSLLPVSLEGMTTRDDPEPLRSLARFGRGTRVRESPPLPDWENLRGPFRVALATAGENTVVDQWMTLPDGSRRPFLVRQGVGRGAVTWMAQDPGDPAFTRYARSGWLNIWDHVFDWRNDSAAGSNVPEEVRSQYAPAPAVDFGAELISNLERKGRVGWYIALAVVFFVLYWLAAGPGLFLYLAGRRRTHLSWWGFAVVALAATLLTMAVVRLLLRGPPELRHLTLVRGDRGELGEVRSRFGLYIPRDGMQRLALQRPPAVGEAACISALPIHPGHLNAEFDTVAKVSYRVPLRDASTTDEVALEVPYRSTVKQFESRWIGPLPGRIAGSAVIGQAFNDIEGRLTNGTGHDLKDVYIAYKIVLESRSEDWMLYLPEWKSGVTIELRQECFRGTESAATPWVGVRPADVPGQGKVLMGRLSDHWAGLWQSDLRRGIQLDTVIWTDSASRIPRAVPLLSLFDRLPPVRGSALGNRNELFRRGARWMDLSAALAAGGLVVVAEAVDVPLPVGLQVNGEPVEGSGRIVYQFVLPAKRKASKLPADVGATTQPD
ncbi:MAG: hypothetical protein NZ561_00185, partial [Phycisphaerae bacterium]|nr:hypothetical protein [Phycisphaerae bacterium]